jgi:hypothetical protein
MFGWDSLGMKPGTPQHRDLFCRTFVETHARFEPEALPWPRLEGADLERLRSFPFWSQARAIEQRAGRMVTKFAQTLDDPAIREAVALQGVEETRHGRLMAHVLERYGIDAPQLPIEDGSACKEDFLIFGFGECTDSFIGFGAFAIARERKLFADELMAIFENVLWEEARHITFFINWWCYEEALAGRALPGLRTLGALSYHRKAIARMLQMPKDGMPAAGGSDLGEMFEGVTPARFLEAALAENRRHMSKFDPRLIQPTIVPTLASLLLLGLRMLPPRPSTAPAELRAVNPSGNTAALTRAS